MRKIELEDLIAKKFNRKYCIMVGSATTALTFLLKRFTEMTGFQAVFPSTSCLVAYSAALYANISPLFSDISLNDATFDMDKLEDFIRVNPSARIIIPTHLYGHLYDIERMNQLSQKYGLLVIEDAAQAMGGSHLGQPVGSFGQASIISFGHTKILEAGHGGAILTDDKDLYNGLLISVNQMSKNSYKPSSQLVDKFHNQYRSKYYNIIETNNPWNRNTSDNLIELQNEYKDCFVLPYDESYNDQIANLLLNLDQIIAERTANTDIFNHFLQSNSVIKSVVRNGSVNWRYTFRVPKMFQQLLLKYLRLNNIHCSSWYPCYPKLFTDQQFPNSNEWADSVVNLWVDGTYNQQQITEICNIINTRLGEDV